MEPSEQSIAQMLASGRKLMITKNRAEAECALMRGEIAVYDDRFTPDPSFRVFRSCDIRSKSLRREVLSALIAYDAAHPSDPPWKRTLPSLEREWLAHNFAYRLGFLKSRARDVDLDNHAEGKGSLGYFIRSAWGVLKGYLKQPNNNKR